MHGASGPEERAVGQACSSRLSSEPGVAPRPGQRQVKAPARAGGTDRVPVGGHGTVVNRSIAFRGTFTTAEMYRTWERELRLIRLPAKDGCTSMKNQRGQ